jgi:molybdate/tungstate transport system permease protein
MLHRLGRHGLTLVFALLGLVIFLFIVVPLAKMLFSSVAEPGIFLDTITDSRVTGAIWLTLYAALIATLAGFLLGIPLAYFLARHDFPGKKLIEGLIDVPIVVPHTAAGIALLFVFGRNFAVGKAFGALDPETRENVQQELRNLHTGLGITVLHVTRTGWSRQSCSS